jgi:maltose alpha-D-glucosyltransferase / alpha-amylase
VAPGRAVEAGGRVSPKLVVRGAWLAVLSPEHRVALSDAAARYVRTQRYFRRNTASDTGNVEDVFVLPDESSALLVVRAGASDAGTPYTLPVRFVTGAAAEDVVAELVVERGDGTSAAGALVTGAGLQAVGAFLVALAAERKTVAGEVGRLIGETLPGARSLGGAPLVRPLMVEQSHSMLRVGEHAVAKLLRALDPGDDTEFEVGRFLASVTPRAPVPALLGWVGYAAGGPPASVLVVSEHVENQGTAFDSFRRALAPALRSGAAVPPELVARATLLARRTAELHRALASPTTDPAFMPEPFDAAHAAALVASARDELAAVELALVGAASALPFARHAAAAIQASRAVLERRLGTMAAPPGLVRVRCHGDYHLGQVLSTGADFVIVDLGGEPLRGVEARREKHCPLRDVAGMLRSFDYAVETCARELDAAGAAPGAEARSRARRQLEAAFLDAYLAATRGAAFVPADRADVERLLDFYVLDKCVYELAYELAQRPAWLPVPVAALERLTP